MKNILLVADTRNLNFCIYRTFKKENTKLDYRKYIQAAVGEDILYKAMAYGINNAKDTHKFRNFLKHSGFVTHFHDILIKSDKTKYIGCQVALSVDVANIINTGKVDKVILGVTDLEYVDLINYVKNKGIACEVYACSIPRLLRDVADKYTEIAEDLLYDTTSAIESE